MIGALKNKGERPLKSIDEVGKGNRMLNLRVGLDSYDPLIYLCNCSLVFMRLSIIRRRENCQC
jgi:hypothetical protein